MSLLTGLTEFWSFDNTLKGVNGNVLSGNSETAYDAGKIGQGWNLNASGARVFNCAMPWDPTAGNWGLSLWFKVAATTTFISDILLASYTPAANYYALATVSAPGSGAAITCRISLYDQSNVETAYSADAITRTTDWVHFAASYESSTPDLTIWVNGTSKVFSSSVQIKSIAGDLWLKTFSTVATNTLAGSIDSLGIWNRQLSNADVSELYNSGRGIQLPTSRVSGSFHRGHSASQSRTHSRG